MNVKNLACGFILEFVGALLILYIGGDKSSAYSFLKWFGVCLMIGGPFIFWELLTIREEADHH